MASPIVPDQFQFYIAVRIGENCAALQFCCQTWHANARPIHSVQCPQPIVRACGGVHVKADDFRRIALSLPEATESAHMDHPDFRVRKKIFATLGYPGEDWGMVKLTPDQQASFVQAEPTVYRPVEGGWGRRGATRVELEHADEASLRHAIATAWRNVAPKRLIREVD